MELILKRTKNLRRKVENSSDYIKLPSQFDIHEYKIMEGFTETVMDIHKRGQLFRTLDGKNPFRHFKDALYYTRLVDAYYAFRSRALIGIAEDWCIGNDISYKRP